MILVYLGCLLLLLYYLYTKSYNYWESKGVPFDKPFLIFGSFYNVTARKQHITYVIRDIYNKFKLPYMGIYIFNQPTLVVRTPELIKKILVKDFDKFVNRQIASNESVDPIASYMLFIAKDEEWKSIRTKLTPVFTSGKIKLMFPLIKECGSDLRLHLEKRAGDVEIRDVMKKYSVDIISSCAFGINAYCLQDDDSEILKVATQLLDSKTFVRSFSVFSYFFAPKFVDIFRLTFLDGPSSKYLINVFNTTMKEREEKKIVRNDLVDLLYNLKKNEALSDKHKFDSVKMAAQALTFFSAGNDTTAMTLSFGLYELALNKKIQDRLRQEVQQTFEKYGDFTYEAMQEMSYLDMVLNETMRKYPLTSFLNRKSSAPYTFEDTGFTLDKDIRVIIPIVGLHFDPEYFPDPETFNPDRFNEENKHKIIPYTYLPFGDGPRNCIGQRFAVLVSKVALAYAIKDFVFERTARTSVPLQLIPGSLAMLNKNGLYLKVSKI